MSALKLFILLCVFQSIFNVAAWINVSDRLKDLVVHFESRRSGFEKNWIIRSAYHDSDWSYYSKFTQYSDIEVMSAENTKWLAKDCGGGYLCFESVEYQEGKGMPFRNRYLRASYPSDSSKKLLMLKKEYSPELHDEYQHKVECENEELKKCRIKSKRFTGLYWCNDWIEKPPGGTDAHYVHYSDDVDHMYWRIMAPPPSDQAITIYEGTNEGTVATPEYTKTMSVGITSSKSQSSTVTDSTSIEVSSSFSKFGASAGTSVTQTVSSSWTESSSQVWSAKITIQYKFVIEPRSHLKVTQLKGNYGSAYDIFAENYHYEVTYLDEPTKSYQSKVIRVDLDARTMKLDLSSSAPKVEKGKKVEL